MRYLYLFNLHVIKGKQLQENNSIDGSRADDSRQFPYRGTKKENCILSNKIKKSLPKQTLFASFDTKQRCVILPPPAVGGIKRYRDPSVCLFVCLSHGAAALGYKHAGCLQLSHRRPPEMCGLRTRPRTDVDPPRVELPSARGHIVSPPPGRSLVLFYSQ